MKKMMKMMTVILNGCNVTGVTSGFTQHALKSGGISKKTTMNGYVEITNL